MYALATWFLPCYLALVSEEKMFQVATGPRKMRHETWTQMHLPLEPTSGWVQSGSDLLLLPTDFLARTKCLLWHWWDFCGGLYCSESSLINFLFIDSKNRESEINLSKLSKPIKWLDIKPCSLVQRSSSETLKSLCYFATALNLLYHEILSH